MHALQESFKDAPKCSTHGSTVAITKILITENGLQTCMLQKVIISTASLAIIIKIINERNALKLKTECNNGLHKHSENST